MKITEEMLVKWRACYWIDENHEMIEKCRKILPCTPLEVAKAKGFPIDDILWVLFHVIPEKELGFLECDFSESVLPIFKERFPGDNRVRRCIEVKRLWLDGKAPDKELEIARDAAFDAARAAGAAGAARAARAAWAAGAARAARAAWAAWAAGDAGDAGDAWAAESQKQLEMVIKVLEKLESEVSE